MNPIQRPSRAHVLVVAIAFVLAGCGRAAPTSPDVAPAAPGSVTRAATPVAIMPDDPGPVGMVGGEPSSQVQFIQDPSCIAVPGALRFLLGVVSLVLPGIDTSVGSGRWWLDIHPGSLSTATSISISTASDGTLRVKFGPDGTRFGDPVDLAIDYSGTALDPASPAYVPGLQPVFLYFDPAQGKWVELPSVNDAAHKTLRAKLQHFSTYGVGGRAGW